MIGESRGAQVVEIMPTHDGIVGWVRVKDDTGDTHLFMNGSINGIRGPKVELGTRGTITFDKGPGFALWFWKGGV